MNFFPMFVVLILGTFGSIYLARKYSSRLAQVILTILGATSLWLLLNFIYARVTSNLVPDVLRFPVFPVIAFIVMAIVIHKIPKVEPQQKRKPKE